MLRSDGRERERKREKTTESGSPHTCNSVRSLPSPGGAYVREINQTRNVREKEKQGETEREKEL